MSDVSETMSEELALKILGATKHNGNIQVVQSIVFDWKIGSDDIILDGNWSKGQLQAANWIVNNVTPESV